MEDRESDRRSSSKKSTPFLTPSSNLIVREDGVNPQNKALETSLNSCDTVNQTEIEAVGTKRTKARKSNSFDYSYFERNAQGDPVKFIQHHETHAHKNRNPHEHEVDMRVATIGSLIDGTFHKLRKDRD